MTELTRALSNIRLMAFDVDGVLTDGLLYFSHQGEVMKAFHSRDGAGLKMLRRAGILTAIITGRDSQIVTQRAENIGIDFLLQGIDDKYAAYAELLGQQNLGFSEAGFMGDDTVDVSAMKACAFAASVPDAHQSARCAAMYISRAPAGRGAVREVCEILLRAQNKLTEEWAEVG